MAAPQVSDNEFAASAHTGPDVSGTTAPCMWQIIVMTHVTHTTLNESLLVCYLDTCTDSKANAVHSIEECAAELYRLLR